MDYVLVAQDSVRIERYTRQGTVWVLVEMSDLDSRLHLVLIGCDPTLRDVYDKVGFPPDAEPSWHGLREDNGT